MKVAEKGKYVGKTIAQIMAMEEFNLNPNCYTWRMVSSNGAYSIEKATYVVQEGDTVEFIFYPPFIAEEMKKTAGISNGKKAKPSDNKESTIEKSQPKKRVYLISQGR